MLVEDINTDLETLAPTQDVCVWKPSQLSHSGALTRYTNVSCVYDSFEHCPNILKMLVVQFAVHVYPCGCKVNLQVWAKACSMQELCRAETCTYPIMYIVDSLVREEDPHTLIMQTVHALQRF